MANLQETLNSQRITTFDVGFTVAVRENTCSMLARTSSRFFSDFSNWLAKWMGSHWAFVISAVLVGVSLVVFGLDDTNIAISVVTLLMVFVLQNTQNRDSAALHLKLDEVITHLQGPRDEIAGVESKSHEELEELRDDGDDEAVTLRGRSP